MPEPEVPSRAGGFEDVEDEGLDDDDSDFVDEDRADFERPLDVGLENFDGSGLVDLEENVRVANLTARSIGPRFVAVVTSSDIHAEPPTIKDLSRMRTDRPHCMTHF